MSETVDEVAIRGVPEQIEQDLECFGCGYNLRTLHRDAVCTECGMAVADSFPPVGFDVGSRREAVRLTRGLTVFMFAILLRALFVLPVVAGFRFWPDLGLWTLRAAVDIWIFSDAAVRAVDLLAAAALLFPRRSRNEPIGWTGRLMLTALGISFLTSCWYAWTARFASNSVVELQVAISVELNFVGIGLMWLFLMLQAGRREARGARRAASVAILLAIAAIAINIYEMDYFQLIPVTRNLIPFARMGFEWWRAVAGAFWATLLLCAWFYARRLRVAMHETGRARNP